MKSGSLTFFGQRKVRQSAYFEVLKLERVGQDLRLTKTTLVLHGSLTKQKFILDLTEVKVRKTISEMSKTKYVYVQHYLGATARAGD